MKKVVYSRQCANHPVRTDKLKYVYNGGKYGEDPRAGQLLCKECVKNERKKNKG